MYLLAYTANRVMNKDKSQFNVFQLVSESLTEGARLSITLSIIQVGTPGFSPGN